MHTNLILVYHMLKKTRLAKSSASRHDGKSCFREQKTKPPQKRQQLSETLQLSKFFLRFSQVLVFRIKLITNSILIVCAIDSLSSFRTCTKCMHTTVINNISYLSCLLPPLEQLGSLSFAANWIWNSEMTLTESYLVLAESESICSNRKAWIVNY